MVFRPVLLNYWFKASLHSFINVIFVQKKVPRYRHAGSDHLGKQVIQVDLIGKKEHNGIADYQIKGKQQAGCDKLFHKRLFGTKSPKPV
jgi:hypothetical protein